MTTNGNKYLRPGYTYTVSLDVKLTEDAYQAGYNYTQQADADTGTYSGQTGLYSNGDATFDYYVNETPATTLHFPKPVVRLPSAKLTINKNFSGDSLAGLESIQGLVTGTTFNIYELSADGTRKLVAGNVTLPAQEGNTYPASATYSVMLPNSDTSDLVLKIGSQYVIEENRPGLSGSDPSTTVNGATQDASADKPTATTTALQKANTVTFTNTYTPQVQKLTVVKMVSGEMGSYTDEFNFTLSLKKTVGGTEQTYDGSTVAAEKSNSDGTGTSEELSLTKESGYSFTLHHGQQIVIDVPYGYTATVTETNTNDGYKTTTWKDAESEANATQFKSNSAEMTAAHTIYFKNDREPVTPTGLESNHTTPYVLMITAAGMAGLALIGGIVARRIRRRRQE